MKNFLTGFSLVVLSTIWCSAAHAKPITLNFGGDLVVSGTSTTVSGQVIYSSDAVPENGPVNPIQNRYTLDSFVATVNGVSATADFKIITHTNNANNFNRTVDWIEIIGRFDNGGFNADPWNITSLGFSFFNATDGSTIPSALTDTSLFTTQSQFDAFPTVYGNSGSIPGGRRLFIYGNNGSGNRFHQTNLTAFSVSNTVPEPSSIALLGLGFAGMGIARRRKSLRFEFAKK